MATAGRWLLQGAKALVLVVVFVSAFSAACVWHLNTPLARRVLTDTVNRALAGSIRGTFRIQGIDNISPSGLRLSGITLNDGAGRRVLRTSTLHIQAPLFRLLFSALLAQELKELELTHVRADSIEVWLLPAAEGQVSLMEAIASPTQPSAVTPGRRRPSLRVRLPTIEIGRQTIHTALPKVAVFETRLSNIHASAEVSEGSTVVDIERFSVHTRGLVPGDVNAIAAFHFRSPGTLWGSLDGSLGEIQVNGSFRLRGQKLQLSADLPRITPDAAKLVWPAWPAREQISAHIEAEGVLPNLSVQLSALGSQSELTLAGQLTVASPPKAAIKARARAFDLRLLSSGAPQTSLNLDANLDLKSVDAALALGFQVSSEATNVAGLAIPALQIRGDAGASGVSGHALVLEPGMTVTTDFRVDPAGALEFSARTAPFTIESVPRWRALLPVKGISQIAVQGSLQSGSVQANISGSVREFSYESTKLQRGILKGTVRGKVSHLENLAIELSLKGEQLLGPSSRFATVSASYVGTPKRAQFRANLSDRFGPSLDLTANVSPGATSALSGVKLSVKRQGAEILGSVEEFRVGPDGLVLKNLKFEGAGGKLNASAHITPKGMRIHAHGARVDLDAVTRIIGLPKGWIAGTLGVDADIEARPDFQQGVLHVALGNATLGPFRNVSLRADGELVGPKLRLTVSSLLPTLGALGVSVESTLAGPVFEASSFTQSVGKAELQLDRIQLSWLNPLLFPIQDMQPFAGYASARVSLERTSDEALPAAHFLVETHELELTIPTSSGASHKLSDLSLSLGGTLNGRTGNINLTTVLKDSAGVLLSGVSSADLDLARFERAPLETLADWAHVPLQAEVALERRALQDLPEPFALKDKLGQLKARLSLTGNLAEPSYAADVDLSGFTSKETRFGLPVDVRAHAVYRTDQQQLQAEAEVLQAARRVAQVSLQGYAPPGAFSGKNPGAIQLQGRGQLSQLPLSVFGALADANIVGEVSGPFDFGFKGGEPALTARLELGNAAIDQVPVALGRIEFTAGSSQVLARLHVVEGAGELDATALVPLVFVGAVPHASEERPIVARVSARRFNAGILLPLLSDVFTELGGRIDANLDAELQSTEAGLTGTFSGNVKLEEGQLQLAALGMRLNDVSFSSVVQRVGAETHIVVKDVRAKARSEVTNIEADGVRLRLDGLKLKSGQANVRLIRPVPLLLEGVSQASITGEAALHLERQPQRFLVTIIVPRLQALLPKVTSRKVIDVADNPDIVVSQPLSEESLKRTTAPHLPWVLRFKLGHAVSLYRADLTLPLRGTPELELGEDTKVLGELELTPGGRVQLMGKAFVIERGSVRFDTEDSTNPHLDVTASWRAPNGTTVFVDIRGTFKHATLSLRSDPPLGSEVELQALLLGGSSAEGEASAQATGIGIGAGLLGGLLADTPLGSVELRTASEDTGGAGSYANYTAALPLSDKVWFELSYKRAEDPVAQERDNDVSGTVDWRFRENWSLRTELGGLGTKMDLLWRYRY